nr:endonuclease/exonuclease/phosphatase family protein [Oceanicoccus sp. KOV_DT_Chl]
MNLRFILDDLRQAMRALNADLLFLQEVIGERLDAQPVVEGVATSQFEFLADEVWPHHAYGKNAIYQRGHHGNAILSKWPLLESENHDISRWWFSQRGILSCQLENGVYAICIHLGLLQSERRKQLQQLHNLITEKIPANSPLLIAGDFNDWNLSLHRKLQQFGLREALSETQGKPGKTYPARMPLFRMDRIYFRNLQLLDAKVLSGVRWQRLSDHSAVVASFRV